MTALRYAIAAGLLAHCLLATTACAGGFKGTHTMHQSHPLDAAWQAVTAADSAEIQRERIDAFLQANREAGSGPLMVRVRHRDSGEKSGIDKALWEHPERYVLTLSYGQKEYEFVPLSRSSLEPLFRE